MLRRLAKWALLLLALAPAAVLAPEANATEQDRLVERAKITVEAFLDDKGLAPMRVYVQNAYAVLVVPEMLKAGFIIGAEHGRGLLLVRDPQSGNWSEPLFYD